ncbi:MAG: hypothetical protein ACOC9Y_03335 [Chloroflexota bacterium]
MSNTPYRLLKVDEVRDRQVQPLEIGVRSLGSRLKVIEKAVEVLCHGVVDRAHVINERKATFNGKLIERTEENTA